MGYEVSTFMNNKISVPKACTEGVAFLVVIAIALSGKEVSQRVRLQCTIYGCEKKDFLYHSNTATTDVRWVLKFRTLLMFSKRMYRMGSLFGVKGNSAFG